jgi:hypothetical protein
MKEKLSFIPNWSLELRDIRKASGSYRAIFIFQGKIPCFVIFSPSEVFSGQPFG